MGSKHEELRGLITDAIVELCRKEAFYFEELRIEGTVCLVSDRSSVLITQITEQIGERCTQTEDSCNKLPLLDSDQAKHDPDCMKREIRKGLKRELESAVSVHLTAEGNENEREKRRKVNDVNSDAKYMCSFCPQMFQYKNELREHLDQHLGSKPHTCEHCNIKFHDFESLSVHIDRQHLEPESTQWKCDDCDASFQDKPSLMQHIEWSHKSVHTKVRKDENLKDMELTQEKDGIGCKSFADKGASGQPGTDGVAEIVQTFIKMLEGQHEMKQKAATEAAKREKCVDTASESSRKDMLMPHSINAEHRERETVTTQPCITQTLSTSHCSLPTTSTLSHPSMHQLSPSMSMWPALGLGFPSPQLFQQATSQQQSLLQQATSQQQSLLQQATSQQLLQQVTNQQSLLQQAANQQSLMQQAASQQSMIQQATSQQQQQQQQQQSLLDQAVSQQQQAMMQASASSQQQHLLQHSIQPPIQSPQSPRQTIKTDPPVDIQRSPSGKFLCPYCDKTYNFKHTLKDHINKHMGKRPHVCKHCGDSFTHLASLCAHIKRRHDSEMPDDYQCEICHEKFMNLQSLKQHFTWRHKDVKFTHSMLIVAKPDSSQAGPSHD